MRLLLVCATPMELRACLALAPKEALPPDAAFSSGFDFRDESALSLPGLRLEALVCGVGPVAAALAIGHRLGRDKEACPEEPLRGILNLGLAGSYDPDAAPVGSLVLITEENCPEYGLWPHQDGAPLPLSFPQAEIAGKKVFNRLELEPDEALGNMGLNWHSAWRRGAGVTVAGVSGTPQRAGLMRVYSGGLTENMEGFSLALGAALAGVPFAELRAVSNPAGLRPPLGWDVPLALNALGLGLRDLLAPFF